MSEEISNEKAFGCVPVCPQQGGRFLLVLNADDDGKPDHWSFPKDHKEPYEYEVNAAIRELEEETGLLPDEFIKDEIFQESYQYKKDSQLIEKRNTYYLALFAEMRKPESQTKEVLDTCWVSYEEAKDKMRYQSSRDILTEAYMRLTMNGLI
jgi:8-oxo-dGTP pyrophosphatase MutT (NUDIX family)